MIGWNLKLKAPRVRCKLTGGHEISRGQDRDLMTSLPNIPEGVEADALVEDAASACTKLDGAIVSLHSDIQQMTVAWSALRQSIADNVVILARNGYIATDSVTEALGDEFAYGPLQEAAVRRGWLVVPVRGEAGRMVETEHGEGVLDAINHCLASGRVDGSDR